MKAIEPTNDFLTTISMTSAKSDMVGIPHELVNDVGYLQTCKDPEAVEHRRTTT
jgi:hypothetical protein